MLRMTIKPIVVLDNSAALGLLLPDERQEASVLALIAQAAYVQFLVPALWRYEIANGLNMALRRNRIETADLIWIYEEIKQLDIQVTDKEATFEQLIDTAQQYGLTGYDAAYLELALRMNAKLASNDKQLKAAAIKAGITVI